jgi:aminoglycoside phosphotransferase (APT) family kinase protein
MWWANEARMDTFEKKVEKFLKERFGPDVQLLEMTRTGKGLHGSGYRLRFNAPGGERRIIMKGLAPSGFGHDHYSDRAQVLLLANANYRQMAQHVKACDVAGEEPERLFSLGKATEFYLFMEEARGAPYFKMMDEIMDRGRIDETDRDRARRLASFLAGLHRTSYSGKDAKTLYRRRVRDLIGHGECIMGIIDAYDTVEFTTDGELVGYAAECLKWWGRIRDRWDRLCDVHGDFHPGNIWFDGDQFMLLDRSRGKWGEAADDVSCLAINYIYYAIKERGGFEGPFVELLHEFLDTYLRETGDEEIFRFAPPFFAFRALVIAHPSFYPDDSVATKRKLLDFGRRVAARESFEMDKIPKYIGER